MIWHLHFLHQGKGCNLSPVSQNIRQTWREHMKTVGKQKGRLFLAVTSWGFLQTATFFWNIFCSQFLMLSHPGNVVRVGCPGCFLGWLFSRFVKCVWFTGIFGHEGLCIHLLEAELAYFGDFVGRFLWWGNLLTIKISRTFARSSMGKNWCQCNSTIRRDS